MKTDLRTPLATSDENPGSQPLSDSTMHACSVCHQVWAGTLMVQVDSRWLCQLCKERALEDGMAKERRRYRSSVTAEDITRWGFIFTLVAIFGWLGVRLFISDRLHRANNAAIGRQVAQFAPAPAEAWAQSPPEQWPAVVGRGEAVFSEAKYRAAGNVCLVSLPDGKVAGLTVSSVSGADDVLDENAEHERFENAFESWKVNSRSGELAFAGVHAVPLKAWLEGVTLLAVPAGAELPTKTLQLRRPLYAEGTKLFVIAAQADGGQVVHIARVLTNESSDGSEVITTTSGGYSLRHQTRRGDGSATTLRLDAKAVVSEVVGAPVLDAQGHLAAVITEPVADAAEDEKTGVFYAFGMEALRDALAGREPAIVGKKPARLKP